MNLQIPGAILRNPWLHVFEHRGENCSEVVATTPFGELGLRLESSSFHDMNHVVWSTVMVHSNFDA